MELEIELEKAKKEIFRFESLQEYFSDGSDEIENEIKKQWKETEKVDMNLMQEWHEFIKKKTESGIKFIWVRMVEFPLNDYVKSQLHIYKRRIKYGIDIRIITKEKLKELQINPKDFYLIDNEKVVMMIYGENNEYLNCEENKEKEKYEKYKELLIENSTPILEFNY